MHEREILEGNDFQYGLCDILHFPNMVGCIYTHTHTHTHTHTLPRRDWVYVPHNLLNLGRGLWQFWPIDNGANDILWLPRLGCKENATPGPWEPSLDAVRTLNPAHLEGPRRRWAEFSQLMSIIKDQTCEWVRLQRVPATSFWSETLKTVEQCQAVLGILTHGIWEHDKWLL